MVTLLEAAVFSVQQRGQANRTALRTWRVDMERGCPWDPPASDEQQKKKKKKRR
jgi:hypothetical protein